MYNKKGISIMIGYVLLVTFAVIMGIIVYQLLKSYAEGVKGIPECPDDVSISITDVRCTPSNGDLLLDFVLKNNGLFDINGYYIHATNNTNQTVATIDLSKNIISGFGGSNPSGSTIVFPTGLPLKPTDEMPSIFNITEVGEIYSIEIIPFRSQIEEGKYRTVSCKGAKIERYVCS